MKTDCQLVSTPLSGVLGSSVSLSKEQLLSGVYADEIRQLLVDRGVLCFPKTFLNDDEQRTFALTIGDIASEWDVSADKSVNRNEVLAEYQKSSVFWHIDGFGVSVPEFATVITPRVLASGNSGATEFANCYTAYRDLPEADRQTIEALKVEHSFETLMRLVKPNPSDAELQALRTGGQPHVQPMVWHHSSGLNSILLGASASRVLEMPLDEGRALIDKLNDWIAQPRYVYRYHWKVGDLVMWNNTGVLHRAVPYGTDSKRLMHRTTIKGFETPV